MELTHEDVASLGVVTMDGSDAYLSDFTKRAQAGTASPLDRANAAVLAVEQAVGILTGDSENTDVEARIALLARFKIAREAAIRVARFTQAGEDAQAGRFATLCERIAVSARAFDMARFDGLSQPVPFEDGRKRRIARKGGAIN